MKDYVRLDTYVSRETKKLLDLAKILSNKKKYDEVLYWLLKGYVEVCTRRKLCEPESFYKKVMNCVQSAEGIFIR